MQPKSSIMMRVLLNRYHPKFPNSLLQSLPNEEINAITNQEIGSNNAALSLTQPIDLIRRIHYSWMESAFHDLPKAIHASIVASLPEPQKTKLRKLLHLPADVDENLSQPLKTFFVNNLYSKIKDPSVLPLEYLPRTQLSILPKLEKPQLVELINFLGLFDLAEEVRFMINKTEVKKLQTCLNPKQRQFLYQCLHHKEKIASTPLDLKKWDGDCKKLEVLLHKRGLLRLGKALCGQHPDLLWHITRILDTGRGTILASYFTPQAFSGVTPALLQQVINLIEFLNLKSAT
jgi:hypothetical protein